MKRLLITIAILLVLGVVFVSCDKNNTGNNMNETPGETGDMSNINDGNSGENNEENGENNEENGENNEEKGENNEENGESEHVHSFGEWQITKDPTCLNEGTKERSCFCGEIQSETVVKTDHEYVNNSCKVCNEKKASIGLKFRSNGDGTCCVYDMGDCKDIDIVIPAVSPNGDKVISIGERAFHYKRSIKSVYLPEGIIELGDGAFLSCSALESITIPSTITHISGDGKNVTNAFEGCNALKSVYICDVVAWCNIKYDHINANPLSYGANLYLNGNLLEDLVVPGSVEIVNDYAFRKCPSIKSVTFESGVTTIGESAFAGCSALESVTLSNSISFLAANAFRNCSLLKYNEVNGLYFLGNKENPCIALIGPMNKEINEVNIPESTICIGMLAFQDCTSIDSIVIPDRVVSLGVYAFKGCTSLKYAIIGDGVVDMGTELFSGCTALTDVVIGDGITYLDEKMFEDCRSIERVTIGKSVSGMGAKTFNDKNNIVEYFVDPENPNYKTINGSLYSKDGKKIIRYTVGRSDEKFVFPDGVTEMGNCAFWGADDLKEIVICEGVKVISTGVFCNCTSLETITIPSTVTDSHGNAFGNVKNLKRINITDLRAWCEIKFYYNTDYYTGNPPPTTSASPLNHGAKLYLNGVPLTNIVVPDGTTKIANHAFASYDWLESITIPASVRSIENFAFNGCDSLEKVDFANGLESINEWAFINCTSLKEIIIPGSVNTIGEQAFYECTSLTKAVISNGVYDIGKEAFTGCSSLVTLELSNTLRSIGWGAFYDCILLNNVTLPSSLDQLGAWAFYNCYSLTSINIPLEIKTIGESTFGLCSSLESIIISKNLATIERSAFELCENLTLVYYEGTNLTWSAINFTTGNEDIINAKVNYEYKPE